MAYMLIWMVIAIIQTGIELYFFHLVLAQAAGDAFISNLIHLVTGLAIWYPVRFNPLSPRNLLTPLVNITAAGVLTVFVWVGGSYMILGKIFSTDPVYQSFLHRSLPYRIVTDVLFYIVLVLVYSLIVYSANLREKVSTEAELRSLVREAELNALKAQINPHFLFNTLNSLSLLTTRDPVKARDMIIKLSGFLRYSLSFDKDKTVTLREELDNMTRYLDIEKVRFGDRLIYENHCDEDLLDAHIPNMILQPLFENAIKHGVYESTRPICIQLTATGEKRMPEITVVNDFDPGSVPVKGMGIGLQNVNERLKLLYGRNDLLSWEKKESTFRVKLTIPQPEQDLIQAI